MKILYNHNGLVFWGRGEIAIRERMIEYFQMKIENTLCAMNQAWRFYRIDAPILTPDELIGKNYALNDMWEQRGAGLFLRPETTPGSYAYARHLLDTHSKTRPPFCVWQAGKSFRKEQDNVLKNMRLKEFYQQEFQCIYAEDTKCDYMAGVLSPVSEMVSKMIGCQTRIVESDRLPYYSDKTMDVEADNGDQWMEIVSISQRRDFPGRWQLGEKSIGLKVLEISIGLDRCVYCFGKQGPT